MGVIDWAAKLKENPDAWTENLTSSSLVAPSEVDNALQGADETNFCRVSVALMSCDIPRFQRIADCAHNVLFGEDALSSAGSTSTKRACFAHVPDVELPTTDVTASDSWLAVKLAAKIEFTLGTRRLSELAKGLQTPFVPVQTQVASSVHEAPVRFPEQFGSESFLLLTMATGITMTRTIPMTTHAVMIHSRRRLFFCSSDKIFGDVGDAES